MLGLACVGVIWLTCLLGRETKKIQVRRSLGVLSAHLVSEFICEGRATGDEATKDEKKLVPAPPPGKIGKMTNSFHYITTTLPLAAAVLYRAS